MLPLHSQITAAIYNHIGQALLTNFWVRNVFNKQTGNTREIIIMIQNYLFNNVYKLTVILINHTHPLTCKPIYKIFNNFIINEYF